MRTLSALGALIAGCLAVPLTGAPAWSAEAACDGATPTALSAFFDGAVPGRLAAHRVPGAVVSVVKDDATVFARGYGQADVERGTAFDAQRSLVRIASITKLFTWTAVMQQVEAGRLDLDTDVNRYLTAFRVPSTYPQPVTLRALMNHTAGFEERVIGTAARSAADVPPLATFLAANMPARIRPPGEISGYSNYGAALAGYIVSEVSGEPYDRYVQRHLLDPLGMTHSTATEPVPHRLAADLARGYDSDAEPVRPMPFMFDVMTPDGSVSATAADMATFMRAHLNDGATSMLSASGAARMHTRSYAADPRLSGYAHGFMDRVLGGRRVLMHDGSWEGFQSVLILVPDCRLGLFLSTNATGGVTTAGELVRAFFDRFVPAPSDPEAARSSPRALSPARAGFYQPARHNESTIEKLVALLGPARLSVADDGTVRFAGKTWTTRGDGLYEVAGGTDHLVFLAGADGRRYVATDGAAYQLMPSGATPIPNLVLLLALAVTALSAIAVPGAWLVRRIRRRPSATTGTWRTARSLAAGAAGLGLVFVILLATVLLGDTSEFLYGVPVSFRVLLILPVAVLALTAAAATCTILSWRGSGARLTARAHQVVMFVGLGALTWFLWYWNLIGWQF